MSQVIDPTIGGRVFIRGKPLAGSLHTSEGLLAWKCRHDLVVVLMVYPAIPYAERLLSGSKLLAAMDVPGVQLKEATDDLTQTWGSELKLPFKVQAEVFDWLYHILGMPMGDAFLPPAWGIGELRAPAAFTAPLWSRTHSGKGGLGRDGDQTCGHGGNGSGSAS
jgi:hypothetical protein